MTTFFDRTETEKAIIRKAYDFEINCVENDDLDSVNPYLEAIKKMGLLEALNEAIKLHYGN